MIFIPGYRLIKRKWKDTAFDGIGAKRYGGRWNSKGKSCVYVAGSEPLAVLEAMVHLEDYSLLQQYVMFQIQMPKNAMLTLPANELPENWRELPAPAETAEIGDNWLDEGISLALAVPSAILPRENNFLLNPSHPDFEAAVATAQLVDFEADPRL